MDADVPAGWKRYFTSDRKEYFYCAATNTTQWDHPCAPPPPPLPARAVSLPPAEGTPSSAPLVMGGQPTLNNTQDFAEVPQVSREPQQLCGICRTPRPVCEMYTADCDSSHRFCFECIRRNVKQELEQRRQPGCPQPDCGHHLSHSEVKQLFEVVDPAAVKLHSQVVLTALSCSC